MQNSTSQSFNDKFRDECHNDHWGQTVHQARAMIATGRRDHDEDRPHGSIGRIPPACFAERHRMTIAKCWRSTGVIQVALRNE